MLTNGSFTEGWEDMPPAPGHLVNQRPKQWSLRWLQPGAPLFDSADTAHGVPECVHKLAAQLPPNEQRDGPDALILEGDTTYKVFHAASAFGAELSQTVDGLQPGAIANLTVPILAVLHDETDPFGAESGVWVNGEGGWVDSGRMGNRAWYRHRLTFTVPENGRADIIIRFKSKWDRPKDFFIDGVTLEAEESDAPLVVLVGDATPVGDPSPIGDATPVGEPAPTPPTAEPDTIEDEFDEPHGESEERPQPSAATPTTVTVSVPEGMKLITAESDAAGVVVVVVPRGTIVAPSGTIVRPS